MMKLVRGSLIVGSTIALQWMSSAVIAQENPIPSPDGIPPAVSSPQLDNQPAQPSPQLDSGLDAQLPSETLTVPSCPAGQFASAFPDVRPEDWAYEAVNRLAIGPIRCFPR
jgi:hypothetical protein